MVQANYSAAQVPVGTVPVASPSTTSANKVNQAVTEVLTLRLAPRRKAKAVRWSEEVVDNESMNKKKSKKCCIFTSRKALVTGVTLIAMMNAMAATNRLIVASQMTSKRHRANSRARGYNRSYVS
ncbi:MAG: phosphatase inhibitor [Trebouxia sp. A1-2]|nr:MAG: phosphatase inhibitor [Trebouxia sp. A1-2]